MTVTAVHHLSCATMCPVAGRLLGAPRGERAVMVAHCLLVETSRDGLVLVDTGFGTRDCTGATRLSRSFKWLCKPSLDMRETALAQIEGLGYSARELRHIVVTHLDVDHAGGLADFPNAVVHLHARELAAARTRPTRKERERYLPAHWRHGPRWQVYEEHGDTWRGLPAISRLRGVDADIGLVPLHGHTRGHSAVTVKSGDRWLVHAGDAYFHRATISAGDTPLGFRVFERAMEMDGRARIASVAALRELRASYDDLDIFSAHDPVELAALQARTSAAAA